MLDRYPAHLPAGVPMNKRLLPLLLPCLALLTACPTEPPNSNDGDREPYLDEWRVVAEGPADALKFLSIGDRLTMDNFANRGDVEVIFDAAATTVKVEMQRFTIASSQDLADAAFGRMQFWGYNSSSAAILDPMVDADLLCFTGENDACYIRAYYDGQNQPVRDGANFRVTLPAGWNGDLEIVTEDNLNDGVETYPDRSDVTVTGLTGTLLVDLDSGNVKVKVDEAIQHYAGCASNDICESGDPDAMPPVGPFDPACGCTDPTFVTIENSTGRSSNITIDVPTTSSVTGEPRWYDIRLENEGMFSGSSEFICQATINCDEFGAGCVINPDFADLEYKEWAEVSYPGDPAIPGTGIQINATSKDCANIKFVEDPADYDIDMFPEEQRGNLTVCSGCL
ncbi:purine-nucleoside phosphorylase [Nannocystaceae bacterium ST9]